MPRSTQLRDYISYKIISDELFKPVKEPDWSKVQEWNASERRRQVEKIRDLHFRCKLCAERRIRYKFTHLSPEQWNDGHERAITEAKEKTRAYLDVLERLYHSFDEASKAETSKASERSEESDSSEEEESSEYTGAPVAKDPSKRRKHRSTSRGSVNQANDDWLEYKRQLDRESADLYHGLHEKISKIIEKHLVERLNVVAISALVSITISEIPWQGTLYPNATWMSRAMLCQRYLKAHPAYPLESLTLTVISRYGKLVTSLSGEDDNRDEDWSCMKGLEGLPSELEMILKRMRRTTVFHQITSQDLRPHMPFATFVELLRITTVLNATGISLGEVFAADRQTIAHAIITLRKLDTVKDVSDVMGMSVSTQELYSSETVVLTWIAENGKTLHDFVQEHESKTRIDQLKRHLRSRRDLFEPYKLIYLVMEKKTCFSDAVLRPRKLLQQWMTCNCLHSLSMMHLVTINMVIDMQLARTIYDTALFYLKLEGWPQPMLDALELGIATNRICPEWQDSSFTAPERSLLKAETAEEFAEM